MYFPGNIIISDLNNKKLLQFISVIFDFFELIKTHKELASEAKCAF